MKTRNLLLIVLMALPYLVIAQYCEPPSFLTGPFTGIINVSLDGSPALNNTTVYNEGYVYYSSIGATSLGTGAQYTISVTTQDDISYGQNTIVWIDWNSDQDFDDPGEEVAAWDEHAAGVMTETITVPTGATLGMTRMRVYTDMTTSMGHIVPEPCGYLNYPSHALGHHGGVEDYDIDITNSSGISNTTQLEQFKLVYNNNIIELHYNLLTPSDMSVEIFNIVGKKIYSEPVKAQSPGEYIYYLEINNLEINKGIYMINVILNGKRRSFKIAV